jgi:hypothetical protein
MGIINISDMENEIEKTPEELKAENEMLSKSLAEMSEKIKSLGIILVSGKEQNVKLTYAVRLFAETHLTRDEKLAIAQEFDRASNADQVDRIYTKYMEQICPPGVDIEKDFLWSPGFTRDMEKYYFKYKGYNPFQVVDSAINIIRTQYKIEDDLRITDDPEKIKVLREAWQINKEASSIAIDEILAVTNEILKK